MPLASWLVGWFALGRSSTRKDVDETTSFLPAGKRPQRPFCIAALTETEETPIRKNPPERAISLSSLKLFDTSESSP